MNREELFKRTKDVLNPETTRDERLVFFGVGSGGARVAEEVARFGVGNIMLVDRPEERMEEHNIIRHSLGYSSLGALKVGALKNRILDINPDCNVETQELDVLSDREKLKGVLGAFSPTQVHICTDNESSKHAINSVAVSLDVPILFAGVFDGGCGGEVGRVMPGAACYACMASYLNRTVQIDSPEETFDYTNPLNEEEKSTPALNIDIAQITLIQARAALITIQAKHGLISDLEGNYILFGNRKVEGMFPRMLHSEIWDIPKLDNCFICGEEGALTGENEGAEEIIAAASADAQG